MEPRVTIRGHDDIDFTTLTQLVKDAEETRRRSIEVQEKIFNFIHQSGHKLRPDDVVKIHRSEQNEVEGVSVPRLEGKSVPKLGLEQVENQVKRLYAATDEKGSDVAEHPPQLGNSVREHAGDVKAKSKKKKIASVKNESRLKTKKLVGPSKAENATLKPPQKNVTSKLDSIKSKVGSKRQEIRSKSKAAIRKKTTSKKLVEALSEQEAERESRPTSAALAIQRSKELLDSIGRRDTAKGDMESIQAYLDRMKI